MENKKTFGEYICRRRKELGLTQKEFAQRLFVTESAVSKWERGLSYPDVTLLRDICAILEISEHELLTASEDTEGRRVEQLAKKYLALTRSFRLGQYIFYGIVLLVCLIINLSADHRLDWFFIALTVTGAFASLTLVPALVEQYRGAWAAGSFTLWTELALLTSCLYTGGDWFPVAAMGTLFGLSIFLLPAALRSLPLPGAWQNRKALLYFAAELVLLLLLLAVCAWDARASWFPVAAVSVIFGYTLVLLPFLMRQIPLPAGWRNRKSLLYFLIELALLLLLLAVCAWDARAGWFPVAAVSVIFGVSLVLLPFLMRQIPLPEGWRNRKSLLYFLIELALLLLLLAVCAWDARADWFPVAAVSVIFGVTLVFLPFLMHQVPLPEKLRGHKVLVYFSLETVLLLVLELICSFESQTFWFFLPGLPLTLFLAALPWAMMLLIRYVPISGWFKASGCCALVALYHAVTPAVVDRILFLSGEEMDLPLTGVPWFTFHWGDWSTPWIIGNNVNALFCLGMIALAVIYLVIGILRRRQQDT